MTSLIKFGVFFVLLITGALGRFLPGEIFRNTSNRISNEASQEDCNCEWRFYQHYEAKGCQIVQTNSCGCPTNYLCSSVKQPASQSKVCLYQNVEYKVGEKIKLADNCQVCRCVDGITPQVVCRQRECPQLDLVEGENCHLVYEENKCCPSRYECIGYASDNTAETSGITCVYNNITYPLGAKIYSSDDPCLVCECKEDWNGIDNSTCYQQECVFERKKHLLDAGCIPIYHERKCCPIEYYCPEDLHYNNMELRELETENSTETEEGNSCIFGGNSYEIGAELSLNKSCVKCICQVPPDFTCVHQSCSLPPSAENCIEIRSVDQCCPTYDCLLGDSAATETSETEESDNEISTTEEGVCPTPLCADDSCRIEVPPGHECPTCVCGESREKNDFEPVDSPLEQYYMENSSENEGANEGNQTFSSFDDSDNELLSKIFVEKLSQQSANFQNLEEMEPPIENSEAGLQSEDSTLPETEEYFIQFRSHDVEDVENHLAPKELRQKRSVNTQTDEIQDQQSQQQWNVLQQDEDEMETSETIGREREFSDESNEGFDEIKAFRSKGTGVPPAVTVELEDTDLDKVIWVSIVPGCPTPLCADSSCRIGIPQGHKCPTCICKKARQP
ncbi:uncharacterized protein LOC129963079 [Argiope bruennichi]|uniref:uncharacterized protein LOC129963079 n=1 Tax=Argiope bruennichi TaxID=94029 RepID=UPI002494A6D5|nr:uncharacterized protein LOC129963079 [Argiope bruennichi]